MNFWEFADRLLARAKWPAMRDWLAIAMLCESTWIMDAMMRNPDLAKIEFFKLLAQAIVIQGFLTTVLAFFFTASKSSEKERENLGAALGVAQDAGKAAALATAVVAGTTANPTTDATITGEVTLTPKDSEPAPE